jgi:hypothetical protein
LGSIVSATRLFSRQLCGRDERPGSLRHVPGCLAGVLNHRAQPSARAGRRVAGVVRVAQDGLNYCGAESKAIDQVVGSHQADRGRAVRKRKNAEMPAGSLFRISRQLCAFVSPVAEFSAWTGAFGDIDVRRFPICNPPVPAEWQRRTLDAPSQEPMTEKTVNTPEAVEVEGVLVKPYDLHDFVLAGRALPGEEALVHQRELIVWTRITIGCGAIHRCTGRTYPDCH